MNYKQVILMDKARYGNTRGGISSHQRLFRHAQCGKTKLSRLVWKAIYLYKCKKIGVEIYPETRIGEGLYIGHLYCITINPQAIIGRNCNIHRGVLIGRENRGKREGTPIIGDNVWIGINASIIGNVQIGSDVLIASNSFVNCDIPSHSVVFGNPCQIKPREYATKDYINHPI